MTTLGIDHGYGMMKTTNTQMLTGVVCYDAEPHSLTNTLQWSPANKSQAPI